MQNSANHEELKSSIIKALLYSDIFSYPLTANEIYQRLSTNHTTTAEVAGELCAMKQSGLVFQFDEYFTLRDDRTLAARRNIGNDRARKILPRALARGRLLYSFPFIRAVMISGSLAKNYMDEDSDVDFFVVTEPGRLWVARFCVALFKRVFLLNSHKRFCVNYYIDHHNLEIEEKNIFTAMELASLVPVCGWGIYEQLITDNKWLFGYFPNYDTLRSGEVSDRTPGIRLFLEALLNPFGNRFDDWAFRIAFKRFRKLYEKMFSKEDFDVAFKSRKGISKNHDRHFQKHITELYRNKIERFTKDHPQIVLS